ncbi:DUF2069 domain-containing protein [Caballeronia sp. LZ062]|uniref:DUF2069 domain-containing protein n=1 Tax=unclassified Caballeronia TaxID=2646786 RepID=UPI00285C9E40|nr:MULTISPECIES: DUF2069 domain-containing protein [unclassified Caballeronia]MDR5854255.1 DUF2069 domain-containing protein [Caballeronia sp. LZ050]MDR5871214.1 DUF2069 domain-containing protein [Caballeronia sp. LZ062]
MQSPSADETRNRGAFAVGATASLGALIVLALLWELWLAPLRPGAWTLALKALPLACALPGVAKRNVYTLQWSSMLVLLYLAEGVVRGMTDAGMSARLARLEALLSLAFFGCAIAYVARFKRAARSGARARKR